MGITRSAPPHHAPAEVAEEWDGAMRKPGSTVVGEKSALHSAILFLKTVSLPVTTHTLAFSFAQAGIGLLSTAIAIAL